MKQLFFSHTWRPDKLNRDNHKRIKAIVDGMQKYGWETWFDENDLFGNIDSAMASGIDVCECIIVCITEEYCRKISEGGSNPYCRDNCYKEWNYANNRNKLMIPIIMEPDMLNTNNWPTGLVALYLSNVLYIDATGDDLNTSITDLNRMLGRYNLKPTNAKIPALKRSLSSEERLINAYLKSKAHEKTKTSTRAESPRPRARSLPTNIKTLFQV